MPQTCTLSQAKGSNSNRTCVSCVTPPVSSAQRFPSRALAKERSVLEPNVSPNQQAARRSCLHLAPHLSSGSSYCCKSQTPAGSQNDQHTCSRAALSALLKGICLSLTVCCSPCYRAQGEGCRVKSRQIAAYYYLTFLWLTKQLILSIKQPSQATNSFSQEDRGGRQRMVASRRTNNGGKEDLTLL